MNVYLDDARDCPKGFMLARTAEECMKLLADNFVEHLSLDHDLRYEKTGYDVARFMVENDVWAKKIFLHTANPVGRDNIYQLLMRYKPSWVEVYRSPMVLE